MRLTHDARERSRGTPVHIRLALNFVLCEYRYESLDTGMPTVQLGIAFCVLVNPLFRLRVAGFPRHPYYPVPPFQHVHVTVMTSARAAIAQDPNGCKAVS